MVSECVTFYFFFQAEDGIRDKLVTGVQTCALPILPTRISLVGIRRPSFFHSRSVSVSTGPYSRSSTRTIHSSGIALLYSRTERIGRARLCRAQRMAQGPSRLDRGSPYPKVNPWNFFSS